MQEAKERAASLMFFAIFVSITDAQSEQVNFISFCYILAM